MATEKYLELCEEAQKKKLKLAKAQQKQISKIYNDMYINVCKKLSKADPKCLSKRYLEEMKKELEKEMIATNKKVINAIKKNMNQSSDLANKVQLDFFMFVNKDYDLNMKLTFSSMFSKIPKDAMNEILFGTAYKDRNGLSERIWMHTKKFEKDIDYIIAEGIANKRSAYDIAKDLEKYVNPNATKEWEWGKVYPKTNKKIDYNTQRLARTAVNHAFQQAQKRSCEKNPYVEGIKWLTSNSHSRTCQLCKDRAIQNDYNLGEGVYPIKDSPLDHPNGLCTTIPYIPISLEDIGSELRRWIDGENNPKLDDWFKKYGEEFDGVKKDVKKNTKAESTDKNSDIISSKEWLKSSFSSQKKFEQHFKHLKEYNNIKPEEYLDIARKLLSESLSDDVEGFVSNQGWVFKYRKSTNDFAMGHPKGTISTLFKPSEGYVYYLGEKDKYI
ncbi:MAG: hypothetical protein RSC84_02615 [Peptostreptococcaceae bacterium]